CSCCTAPGTHQLPCPQLGALLDHIVGKHCLHLRGDVEQTIIKQHGRGFRKCNLGKTVLNQCDLFRRHCNSPAVRFSAVISIRRTATSPTKESPGQNRPLCWL